MRKIVELTQEIVGYSDPLKKSGIVSEQEIKVTTGITA